MHVSFLLPLDNLVAQVLWEIEKAECSVRESIGQVHSFRLYLICFILEILDLEANRFDSRQSSRGFDLW